MTDYPAQRPPGPPGERVLGVLTGQVPVPEPLSNVCRHCQGLIVQVPLNSGAGTRWLHKRTGEWYCRITVAGPTVDIHS